MCCIFLILCICLLFRLICGLVYYVWEIIMGYLLYLVEVLVDLVVVVKVGV